MYAIIILYKWFLCSYEEEKKLQMKKKQKTKRKKNTSHLKISILIF